ncbi:DUF1302 domain-containing protein [Duganella sp. FT3S]|uniref:DUF1302 domain-containing protein n=1 Tax=Rugamonas fusca TaxID=2758568 RepID=A0A7W2EJF3_9BURK|nr:DUF1302 domain-containing protein [Rugamonas fusca]MBA5607013.1 DUF1302 domain-containing protein [Rugamonas fusca]
MTYPNLRLRPARHALALAAALCAAASAGAGEIDTGNADLSIRFDNTVKYNYARRVVSQNADILRSPNYDDGDRNFDKGTVGNRLDLLSEFDVVWQKRMGMRVSAAAWYDAAYDKLDNASVATSNHIENGKPALGLSDYARRYHKGLSGEVLDAFVFSSFEVGDMPANVKLGKHTLYWGESLLSPIHGVNYGQNAIDLIKGLSVPGTEAKELFLPRESLSAQLSPGTELALAAQYFFKWRPARLPEAGSYLGFYDYGFQGGESLNLGPLGTALRAKDSEAQQRGDFGLSARWSPDWVDGTLGMYYRQTSDLLPQANLRLAALPTAMLGGAGGAAMGAAVCQGAIPGAAVVGPYCLLYPAALGQTSRYQLEYGDHIDMLGLSLSKNVAGMSLGADLNYRHNMPLNSSLAVLMPAGTAAPVMAGLNGTLAAMGGAMVAKAADVPGVGGVSGARGNTWHGVLNLLGTTAKSALYDASTWLVELQWNRWDKVTQGEELFKGRAGYNGVDRVTRDFVGLAINYTPTWFQVLPGVDLSAPIAYTRGLSGTSAVNSGGNKDAGNYSLGLSFDIQQKYKVDVRYVDFFGPYATDASGAITSNAGVTAVLKDRGFVAVTLKTTF